MHQLYSTLLDEYTSRSNNGIHSWSSKIILHIQAIFLSCTLNACLNIKDLKFIYRTYCDLLVTTWLLGNTSKKGQGHWLFLHRGWNITHYLQLYIIKYRTLHATLHYEISYTICNLTLLKETFAQTCTDHSQT